MKQLYELLNRVRIVDFVNLKFTIVLNLAFGFPDMQDIASRTPKMQAGTDLAKSIVPNFIERSLNKGTFSLLFKTMTMVAFYLDMIF